MRQNQLVTTCTCEFSQIHKIGNIGITTNFVFPYICSVLLCLQHLMLVNMKLDISGSNWISFQGYKLHWSSSFLKAQPKQSCQNCGEFAKTPITAMSFRGISSRVNNTAIKYIPCYNIFQAFPFIVNCFVCVNIKCSVLPLKGTLLLRVND